MNRITKIGNEYFETIKSSKTQNMIDYHLKNFRSKTLFDHYNTTPSNIKLNIYDEWLFWYHTADNVSMFEVTSANTFCFTIGCLYHNDDGEIIGYIQITKAHNKLYLLK